MAAAEIVGVSDRTMRRMKRRYAEFAYDGRVDQRRGKRSVHRIPLETAEAGAGVTKEHFYFSGRHFHKKLSKEHQIEVGYSSSGFRTSGMTLLVLFAPPDATNAA